MGAAMNTLTIDQCDTNSAAPRIGGVVWPTLFVWERGAEEKPVLKWMS